MADKLESRVIGKKRKDAMHEQTPLSKENRGSLLNQLSEFLRSVIERSNQKKPGVILQHLPDDSMSKIFIENLEFAAQKEESERNRNNRTIQQFLDEEESRILASLQTENRPQSGTDVHLTDEGKRVHELLNQDTDTEYPTSVALSRFSEEILPIQNQVDGNKYLTAVRAINSLLTEYNLNTHNDVTYVRAYMLGGLYQELSNIIEKLLRNENSRRKTNAALLEQLEAKRKTYDSMQQRCSAVADSIYSPH